MRKTVPIEQLQYGMYVAELDRPWTDTPFRFQGFVLKTPEQLETLKKYCKSVQVDPDKAEVVARLPDQAFGAAAMKRPKSSENGLRQPRRMLAGPMTCCAARSTAPVTRSSLTRAGSAKSACNVSAPPADSTRRRATSSIRPRRCARSELS